MKRVYFTLIILIAFLQTKAQDKVDFLRTKVDGNRNIVDARLRLSHSLNIPRGASWSLNGAKDSIGYVMFNTTLQRFGVYHGSGVWKAYATIDEIELLLDGKVDTIHGKGLSTEDYTTSEKSKLAGIAAGAEVNVNADWSAVSGDAMILNKPTFVETESDPVFLAQKGAVNGVATLNSSGKIPNGQIPALALVDTYVAASQAAMLALSMAEQGDVAIRTDVSKTFILTDNNYSTLASWKELLSPVIPAETDPIWGASPSAGITSTNIANWNTAYSYSQVGHLPLSGGTLSGNLIVNGDLRVNGIYRDYQNEALIQTDGSETHIGTTGASTPRSIRLYTGNTTALTISTSQVATFVSNVFSNNAFIGRYGPGSSFAQFSHSNFGGISGSPYGYLQNSAGQNYINGTINAIFGDVEVNSLIGSGNRIVIANGSNILRTAIIGSGLAFDGTTLTASGSISGSVTTSGLTSGFVPKATGASDLGNSNLQDNGTNLFTTTYMDFVRPLGSYAITIGESAGANRLSIGQEASYQGNVFESANINLKFKSYLGGGTGGNIIFYTGSSSPAPEAGRFNSSGNFVAVNTIIATSFTGAGTGLTGTASSLNIGGNAGSATLWGGKEFSFTTTGAISNYMLTMATDGKVHVESASTIQAFLGLGSNAYTSTSYYPASNPSGFISGINSTMVTTALGYTPTNSTYTISGVSTPTISGITNVSTTTSYDNHYIRVGNEVTVRGKFLLQPVGTGLTVVRVSFPTSPDPTRGSDSAVGSASGIGIANGQINMHVGTTSAEITMNATTPIGNEVYYEFTYTAL